MKDFLVINFFERISLKPSKEYMIKFIKNFLEESVENYLNCYLEEFANESLKKYRKNREACEEIHAFLIEIFMKVLEYLDCLEMTREGIVVGVSGDIFGKFPRNTCRHFERNFWKIFSKKPWRIFEEISEGFSKGTSAEFSETGEMSEGISDQISSLHCSASTMIHAYCPGKSHLSRMIKEKKSIVVINSMSARTAIHSTMTLASFSQTSLEMPLAISSVFFF